MAKTACAITAREAVNSIQHREEGRHLVPSVFYVRFFLRSKGDRISSLRLERSADNVLEVKEIDWSKRD